ncbi:O-acyltransferase like protein-like [Uranotaenia lowii]|uniref:O-acyltransferase like protein-like n=1 Tax=Uranotaenia lowii TaxID=190385 RepID=UPI00247A4AA6|nr:O-acyltransferase like protein-like [Uranotaenia lowii]
MRLLEVFLLASVAFFGSVNAEVPLVLLQSLSRDFVTFLGQQGGSWNLTDSTFRSQDLTCLNQLNHFAESLTNVEPWAVQMYDSWGKVPSGLLFGNTYEFGNFDQCRRIEHTNYFGSIDGQHCTLIVDVRALQLPIPPIWYGICIPGSCRPQLLRQLSNTFFLTRNMGVLNDLDAFCYRNEEKQYSATTIAAIVLFSCYGALLVAATIADFAFLSMESSVPDYVKRFSIYTNLLKIFHTTPRSTSKSETMDCVNGVRALSMSWIIVNHIHDTALGIPAFNPIPRMEYRNSYFGILFHRLGGKAVDIFLLLSGMLVAIKVLRELDATRKLNVPKMWLHRYIRITPAYAALIFFAIAFINEFGEGILYKTVSIEPVEACQKSWWAALLYIQNYSHHKEMCFPYTWYLSVDMQLYFLSPLILIPLWKYGRKFAPVIGLLALLSISCVFATMLVNEYRLTLFQPMGDGFARKTYHPTHTRMSVWLFGVLFGYYLHKTKSSTIRLSKRTLLVGWTFTLVILLLTGYSLKQVYVGDYTQFSGVVDAFYEALHRCFWAFAVMWTIFVCINGQGGVVNQFLGWSFWQPLAKLSYSMYLLHILVQLATVTMTLKQPIYFSTVNIFYTFFGLTGLTAVMSTAWCFAFEYPFFGLENYIFRKKSAESAKPILPSS